MASHVAVLPAVLLLFFFVVQISLWFYARTVATSAAQHGLDAARVDGGNTGAGQAVAYQFLNQVGGFDELPDVTVEPGLTDIEVTVRGDPVTVVPGFSVPVEASVSGPVERVVE